jgi:hypothetical protein
VSEVVEAQIVIQEQQQRDEEEEDETRRRQMDSEHARPRTPSQRV